MKSENQEMKKYLGLATADWALILLFAVVRIFLSFKYTLGVDEAHYAIYGLHPDWSYFDHPPLIGWVHFLFTSVLGVQDWVIRLPAVLSGIISSVLVFHLVIRISRNQLAARWCVLAINVSFLCFGLFLMFLPDSLLLPLTLWLVFIVLNLLKENSLKNWLWLGLCLGLCGLTKYTAVLFVPSLIAISVHEKVWKQWISWKFVGAAGLAFICILPVLVWNWQRDWISFSYQTGHVVGENSYSIEKFISSLAAQIIAYSPFLVVSSLLVIVLQKVKSQGTRVALWIISPCMAFFLYSGFKGFVLPHWSFVVFVIFFACAFAEGFLNLKMQKLLKVSTLLTLSVIFVILIELLFNLIPFKDYKSPYGDVVGWHQLHDQIEDYKSKHPEMNLSVGVANWTLGARSIHYFSDVVPVFVLDDHYDQLDIWENGKKAKGDLILMQWRGFDFPWTLEKACESHEKIFTNVFKIKNYAVNSVDTILCRGFKL